jgi:uncharacterized protein
MPPFAFCWTPRDRGAGSSNPAFFASKKRNSANLLRGTETHDPFFSRMNPTYDQVYEACQQGDVAALQRLFPEDPTQWRGPGGNSLLHVVVQTPHVPVLDWLLTFPLDVNAPTPNGYTPLVWACVYRQQATARRLLAQGADVQATDSKGRTALHWTCMYGWAGGVAWLLERGADPDTRDGQGHLPEDYLSVPSPHYATLRGLLDAARQGCGLK